MSCSDYSIRCSKCSHSRVNPVESIAVLSRLKSRKNPRQRTCGKSQPIILKKKSTSMTMMI